MVQHIPFALRWLTSVSPEAVAHYSLVLRWLTSVLLNTLSFCNFVSKKTGSSIRTTPRNTDQRVREASAHLPLPAAAAIVQARRRQGTRRRTGACAPVAGMRRYPFPAAAA